MNIKGILNKVTTTVTKGVDVYTEATNKAEQYLMSKCGSSKTMDEVCDAGLDKAVATSTVVVNRVKFICK
jgi:hypothetical protein